MEDWNDIYCTECASQPRNSMVTKTNRILGDKPVETASSQIEATEKEEVRRDTPLVTKSEKKSLWAKLFKKNKARQIILSDEPVETEINSLPDFYWSAVDRVMAAGNEKDPIAYVNGNMYVKCPKCGVDYNANGFEIGFLASLVESIKRGTPTTFSSGDKGIYPRCIKGSCPNPNCSSLTASIRWLGDKKQIDPVINGTLIAAFIFKKGTKPPSQNECNSVLNTDSDYRKGGLVEIRTFGGIPKNVDMAFLLMLLAKNNDEHLMAMFMGQLTRWAVVEKKDLIMVKIFDTFYLNDPPGFFIVAFVLKAGALPTGDFCSSLVQSDLAYKPGRASKVQIHPISGWNRSKLSSPQVSDLLIKFHPNIKEGIRKQEVFYDFRKVDNDHLFIRIFGNKYWNDIFLNK